ncbi:unnamed protein product [Vitrella brassicaformis CCMP3155]|uniref:Uncharacterized protein n=1 Tax=Vitrella brassicaformis (strain CCMP3155) TaxID=1169540 RepID=A0A0G4EID9_VITBC|nr:unnamed protein product [Vitrella brassicaformis CCMP3155]|eukprot:CEL96008.1 unnamed protein product [Vitrella brassicaformis CCMP3155]
MTVEEALEWVKFEDWKKAWPVYYREEYDSGHRRKTAETQCLFERLGAILILHLGCSRGSQRLRQLWPRHDLRFASSKQVDTMSTRSLGDIIEMSEELLVLMPLPRQAASSDNELLAAENAKLKEAPGQRLEEAAMMIAASCALPLYGKKGKTAASRAAPVGCLGSMQPQSFPYITSRSGRRRRGQSATTTPSPFKIDLVTGEVIILLDQLAKERTTNPTRWQQNPTAQVMEAVFNEFKSRSDLMPFLRSPEADFKEFLTADCRKIGDSIAVYILYSTTNHLPLTNARRQRRDDQIARGLLSADELKSMGFAAAG